MRLVCSDKFTDVVDVGVFLENIFFVVEVPDAGRYRDHFHVRKFMEAFAHGVDVQILGEFHAVFFHRLEKVVELCIDGAVDFSSARLVFELTKIAF